MDDALKGAVESLDELIALNDKKTSLLKEYKEALIYEKCEYHALKYPRGSGLYNEPERFALYRISDQTLVADGTAKDCRKWLDRRKIGNHLVYNYKVIEERTISSQ